MKFEVNVNGQEFEVDAPNQEALPQIVETISREQKALSQRDVSVPGAVPGEFTGAISARPSFGERVQRSLPGVGQFAGGIAGGLGTLATTKNPKLALAGEAAGGVGGRVFGRLAQRGIEQFGRDPMQTFLSALSGPPGVAISTFKRLSPSERKGLGKEALTTAGIEAIGVPLGAGIGKFVGNIGKGILGSLLGDRVAQRGAEVCFDKILKEEFFEGRIPKTIAKKAGQWFNKLLNVTGRGVKEAVNTPQMQKTFIPSSQIKQGVMGLQGQLGTIDDFSDALVSKAQKKILKEMEQELLSLEDDIAIPALWEARKKLDKILFGKRFAPEAQDLLRGWRKILNDPIKKASPEVAESFAKYSFVRDQQENLGKQFEIDVSPRGETFATQPEKFASRLLKTTKDEQIRLLKELDSFLDVDDKIIDEFLNIAAAEEIEKPIQLLGLPSRILAGAFGGRRSVAGIAKGLQHPAIQAGRKFGGRGLITGATELANQ